MRWEMKWSQLKSKQKQTHLHSLHWLNRKWLIWQWLKFNESLLWVNPISIHQEESEKKDTSLNSIDEWRNSCGYRSFSKKEEWSEWVLDIGRSRWRTINTNNWSKNTISTLSIRITSRTKIRWNLLYLMVQLYLMVTPITYSYSITHRHSIPIVTNYP